MLRTSVIISLISLAGYLLSFISQLLIAKYFGASAQLDAYLAAISIPFLFITVTGGVLSFTMIPILVQKKNTEKQYSYYTGMLFILIIIIATAIPVVFYFLTPFLIELLVRNNSFTFKMQAISMARISWYAYGITIIVNYLSVLHNTSARFVMPVVVNMLPYLGMILCTVFFHSFLGPESLVWGMLLGNILAIPLLFINMGEDLRVDSKCFQFIREIGYLIKRMPLVVFSMIGLASYSMIDVIWATRLGPNNLSYLSYGQRLLVAMCNAMAIGPITVILPYLSRMVAANNYLEFRIKTLQALRMMMVLLALAGVFICILSVPIIKLLFERGAFDHSTTLQVSSIIPGMFVGVSAMICTILLFRAFFAKGDVTGAALISCSGVILYFFLSAFLSHALGLHGIVIAYILSWWIQFIWSLLRLWHDKWSELVCAENIVFLKNLTLITFVCGAFIFIGNIFCIEPFINTKIFFLTLRLLLVALISLLVFLLLTVKILKMREVINVTKLLPFVP